MADQTFESLFPAGEGEVPGTPGTPALPPQPPQPLQPLQPPGEKEAYGQELPPLQGVPDADSVRVRRYYDRCDVSTAPGAAGEVTGWGGALGLPADARARLVDWAAEAVKTTGRPVLELGCGAGGLLASLADRDVPVVGLDLSLEALRLGGAAAGVAASGADREAEAAARSASQAWWAGDAAPEAPRFAPQRHRTARLVQADAAKGPFRPGTFGAVIASDVLCHLGGWPEMVARWVQLLVPGGQLIVATVAEKDQDAPGFLSTLGRALQPGVVTGYPRSQDLTWVLQAAGVRVGAASVFRLRRTFADLAAQAADAPGGEELSWRELIAQASESLRGLYDIDEEGMSWRYMTLRGVKP